ncbi:polysaccharide deacetylase family protein [Flavisolibacter sp. BT320]|nr:polysaccharide deacetylase family protein [Flavisolibacter longurius]
MHKYFLKIPWWVPKLFPQFTWRMPGREKTVYLTFDDGPHPSITPWVLDQLAAYGAGATFFCIGKNVEQYPNVYLQVLTAGHRTGNHTHSHPNGWKTESTAYLDDVKRASVYINSDLFRPPYGRIKSGQASRLSGAMDKKNVRVIMWDVLSADFDVTISPHHCSEIVLKFVRPGSIVVFHDSEKAFPNLKVALPLVLEALSCQGYTFGKL